MKKFVLALDLKNEETLIAEYEHWHQQVWPEILEQIRSSGIVRCEIYRVFNRLVMLIETLDTFSPEAKAKADAENEMVQAWENLMWKYQQAIPGSLPGSKWQVMDCIFQFDSNA